MGRIKALSNIALFVILEPVLLYMLAAGDTSGISTNQVYLTIALTSLVVVLVNLSYIKEQLLSFKLSYLKYIVISFVLVMLLQLVTFYLFPGAGESSQNEIDLNELSLGASTIASYFVFVIFTPILEEIVFRSSVFHFVAGRELKDKSMILIAAVVSVIVFTLVHVTPELSGDFNEFVSVAIPYVIISIGIVFVYVKSNCNVVASIIMHMIANLIAFSALLFA